MDLTQEMIQIIQQKYQVKIERPWKQYPEYTTCKEVLSDKWFALFMQVPGEKLGLATKNAGIASKGEREMMQEKGYFADVEYPVVNVKADTEFIQFVAGSKGILPGYHMNKEHWLTILLDGSVAKEQILSMIDNSYQLITDTPSRRIYEAVKKVPKGKVATYGQIAELAGNPKMSRAVGNALHKNPDEEHIPCFRIVNAKGELSGSFAFGGEEEQKRRLEADGIEVVDGKVDLTKYAIDVAAMQK